MQWTRYTITSILPYLLPWVSTSLVDCLPVTYAAPAPPLVRIIVPPTPPLRPRTSQVTGLRIVSDFGIFENNVDSVSRRRCTTILSHDIEISKIFCRYEMPEINKLKGRFDRLGTSNTIICMEVHSTLAGGADTKKFFVRHLWSDESSDI